MKNFEEFYPTPEELLEKITEGCNWTKIHAILEPSAGKGDIVTFLQKKAKANYMKEYDVDCIEREPELQMILKGKGMRVVYDDFLSFETRKRYDLIIMNPPFSEGDEHLLKALELQKDGGNIICILNAETIRNLYSVKRKALKQKLDQYHAEITFMQDTFMNAERKTSVEIAVVKVMIPRKPAKSFIFEELKKAKLEKVLQDKTVTDVAENDFVKATIQRYEIEVDACLAFIHEYQGLKPYIMNSLKETNYDIPILSLKYLDHNFDDTEENAVVCSIRKKYWKALFADERFTGAMTSQQRQDYMNQVDVLADYDFNLYNIKTLQIQMTQNLISGIEECIINLFDELTHEYSYLPETGRNTHYYNGWCTNKAHIINKKVIIPRHDVYSNIWNKFTYSFRVSEKLRDMEKVFDYLAGIPTGNTHGLSQILNVAEENQQSKNIECKYFTVTFYKKGTCHIVFKDMDLLKKFNIFGSQKKGWLPPAYGKKSYDDMTKEEQAVIDAFEGKKAYEQMMDSPEHYLINFQSLVPQLNGN
ncbi:MAG: DUF4942 domain-containing protein [Lachnospiraceae bacterium]|nr:DUF4942 domain-containing protein [Lachnospiraceae bacterium]